ncbi:mechanosensitive ion channel protein MscS [Lutibacter sp. HS1-25]|uniref:mechanosensitive ion channel family protein n=1 Tax=Lutibacter sp. HS1-25 TaxID=2485000 RepID=UPI001012E5E0|nr:mechanosensitive ion channel domain-containing protein [Lutibacter sp. HS1-25]RXP63538.1 mechanosensitive ion channel protein MscS [Lutibacter sp. HS1-25]
MEILHNILNYTFRFNDNIHISVKVILVLLIAFLITNILLKLIRKLVNKNLEEEDKGKFKSVFSFLKYIIYVFVIVAVLESSGVNISVFLAGSAALLVGLGLGLQTLFQDVISGIFIIVDKTVHVNDIIEIDGVFGKVFEIKLRTTRIVTVLNRVVVIPNHKFLTNNLHNWTQNDNITTEIIDVGVAYGSDVELVKKVLIEAALEHPKVLKTKMPDVLFMDFADSALVFRLRFTINESFYQLKLKSDIRYTIYKKFNENNITIPFPQRDIHVYESKG